MKIQDTAIRAARKLYRISTSKKFLNPKCEMNRQVANDIIFSSLQNDEPCMISRFGTVELNCINNYLCITSNDNYFKKLRNFITDNTHTPWWNVEHFRAMALNAGIFPPSVNTSEKFAERYLSDIPQIDILGSFQYQERFMPLKNEVQKVHLETLYPFFVEKPWTRALYEKKVLVVHPFEDTIRHQYAKRTKLFANQDILPDFELKTIKAVQSAAGQDVKYKDWFEALAHMEQQIASTDFDVCLLGCGAYGLPLAAFVKRIGKKAVHIGGGTQLLFGIKGKRWERGAYKEGIWKYRPNEEININYYDLFNPNWVYPRDSETPKNAHKVEGACYW